MITRVWSGRLPFRSMAPLGGSLAVYLVLAGWLARTKAPWCDEGWFANPAYNLAFHGNMGTNVLEPSGHFLNAYLSGIQQRTYIVVPTHLLALAVWFRLFGFSLFTMRVYSILWGATGLVLLFFILHRLFPDRRVAWLGALLTAIDFLFLWSTADGRMEAPANALALGGLAAYLHFREYSFDRAVLVSQGLAAAAVFTHPNAFLVVLAIAAMVWCYDRPCLRMRHLTIAAAPYLLCAALWSIYIAQSPGEFAAQFFANAAGRGAARWKVVVEPWLAVWKEIEQHIAAYISSGLWPGEMNQWMIFILPLYTAAMIWCVRQWQRHPAPVRMFLVCALTVLSAMTFLVGFKATMYMIYLVPFYNAILAAWLWDLWGRAAESKCIAAAVLFAFFTIQLCTSVQHIRADEFHRDYVPAITELRRYQGEGRTIMGTAALGFGLGFQGFLDDARLGAYSGLDPDVLVVDRSYRQLTRMFEQEEPGVFRHVAQLLSTRYRLVARHGSFWLFERHV